MIHGGPATISAGGSTFEVDEIVVAAGRRRPRPTSDSSGSGSTSALTATSTPTTTWRSLGGGDWLYAVGDICGRALLTHMGKYQARIAGDVIAARAEGRSTRRLALPRRRRPRHGAAVVFTEPQVASVGLTEARAPASRESTCEALEYDIGSVAGASLLRDDYIGRAKLVVDRATDTLVGATFVGSRSRSCCTRRRPRSSAR